MPLMGQEAAIQVTTFTAGMSMLRHFCFLWCICRSYLLQLVILSSQMIVRHKTDKQMRSLSLRVCTRLQASQMTEGLIPFESESPNFLFVRNMYIYTQMYVYNISSNSLQLFMIFKITHVWTKNHSVSRTSLNHRESVLKSFTIRTKRGNTI